MTKAVLRAFFTLCFTRVFHTVAAASNPLTCGPGQTTPNKIDKVGTYDVICPEGTWPFYAPDVLSGDGPVHLKPNDKNACDAISQVVPGACFGKKQKRNATLVITQLPDDPKNFYIYCEKDTSTTDGTECVITVEVVPSERLGPNTCAVKGSRLRLAIEKTNETANFSCGEGRILHPAEFTKKAFAEDCTSEVALPDKVKVTKLAQPAQQYQVTTPELPKHKTIICYVCEKKDSGDPSDKCQVIISIAGSSASGALAVGVAARAAAAVGLTVAALRAW